MELEAEVWLLAFSNPSPLLLFSNLHWHRTNNGLFWSAEVKTRWCTLPATEAVRKLPLLLCLWQVPMWPRACFYKEVFDLLTLCHDVVVYKLYSRTCNGAIQDHTDIRIHKHTSENKTKEKYIHTQKPQVRLVTSLSSKSTCLRALQSREHTWCKGYPNPTSCPLTATHVPWCVYTCTSTHTYTQK